MTRFAYWIGHAYGELGQKDLARQWMQKAAHYPRNFYGQEALNALGQGDDGILHFKELNPSPEAIAHVKSLDPVKALILMARMGLPQEVSSFYYVLQNQMHKNSEREAFISIVHEEAPHAICEVGRLFSDGYSYREFYPVLQTKRPEVEPPLMHAIIRKESDFNSWAVSPAGARGLMQVMPFVAAKICKEQGINFNEDKLCTDPHLNVRLGCRQLQKMVNYYDNDLMLAVASYNSGSKPVDTWIELMGDPRQGHIDHLTFLEEIPYKETRDYVRRVLENRRVYQKLL